MNDSIEVRLYMNTVDTVPQGDYTDITSQVLNSATVTHSADVTQYQGASINLDAYDYSYFWVEIIDALGVSTGPLAVRRIRPKEDFFYTGADQTISVVPGELLHVKAWGAGGSSRDYNRGGAGGYSEATVQVPAGVSQAIIMVGSAGRQWVQGRDFPAVYGGGGPLGLASDPQAGGAGGGGRSALRWVVDGGEGGTEDVVTAGGGGGCGDPHHDSGRVDGGPGGGLTGGPAGYSPESGGKQTEGGVCTDWGGPDPLGTKYLGGSSTYGFTGGSGGGGFFGGAGAGGRGPVSESIRGGGGGSGFVGRDGNAALSGNEWGSASALADPEWRTDSVYGVSYINTRCLRGSGTATAMRNDEDYVRVGGSLGNEGRNGLVIVQGVTLNDTI